jgi:hypothetical protein
MMTAAGCVKETVKYDSKNITIINDSGQSLSIQEKGKLNTLPPGQEVTSAFTGPSVEIHLENAKGDVIYDRSFNYQELEDMKYQVVIPPAGDNVTGHDNPPPK